MMPYAKSEFECKLIHENYYSAITYANVIYNFSRSPRLAEWWSSGGLRANKQDFTVANNATFTPSINNIRNWN